jgi:hypothetical protein
LENFDQWTLDCIRDEDASFNWIEPFRFEWCPITAHAMYQILQAKNIVLVVDSERKWFERYILDNINKKSTSRPVIPIVSLDSMFRTYDALDADNSLQLVEDMLSIAFKDDYFFWYIGRGDDKRSEIAKRSDNSYMWIMGESYQNSFPLLTYDEYLDIKLIQLFQLFSKTLSASLFAEIEIEN